MLKEDEVKSLKPGDKIAIESGYTSSKYRIGIIDHFTPKGRIILKNSEAKFDKTGVEIGAGIGSWYRQKLYILTPEIQAEIDKELEVDWLRTLHNEWSKMPDEARKEVFAVLKKHGLIKEG